MSATIRSPTSQNIIATILAWLVSFFSFAFAQPWNVSTLEPGARQISLNFCIQDEPVKHRIWERLLCLGAQNT
jgi:hypothetical protein